MSLSNNNEVQNPSTRWFQWSGSEGILSYYDKEKKENIPVLLPFKFIVLDLLHTIKGYDQASKSGVYSNEVKDLSTERLNVRLGRESVAIGIYNVIKDKIKANSGKYAQSCYIAYKGDDGSMQIGNIMFVGSSLSGGKHMIDKKTEKPIDGWIEFSKKNKSKLNKSTITIEKNPDICTNGATKFYAPLFDIAPLDERVLKVAIDLDIELQGYLKAYISKTQSEIPDINAGGNQSSNSRSAEDKFNDRVEQNKVATDLHKPHVDDGSPSVFEQEVDDVDQLPF